MSSRRSWFDWADAPKKAPSQRRRRLVESLGDWLTPFEVTRWRPETEAAFRIERARARLVGRLGT